MDDSDVRDPRLPAIARELGISRRELLGAIIDIRTVFHDRRTYRIARRDFDLAADLAGLTDKLIEWEIAAEDRRGVTLIGIEKSVGYLLELHQRQINGGKKSAESRRRKAQLASTGDNPSGRGKSLDPDPSLYPDPSLDRDQENAADAAPVLDLFPSDRPRKPPQPADGYAMVVDAYFAAFEKATGKKPTMGAKQGAQIKRLIRVSGAPEVIHRINRLWSGSLDWPKPPYDLDSLVKQFDRLAGGSVSGRYEPRGDTERIFDDVIKENETRKP